jgi:hypothetical protein
VPAADLTSTVCPSPGRPPTGDCRADAIPCHDLAMHQFPHTAENIRSACLLPQVLRTRV